MNEQNQISTPANTTEAQTDRLTVEIPTQIEAGAGPPPGPHTDMLCSCPPGCCGTK